jgi:hypothetical protein
MDQRQNPGLTTLDWDAWRNAYPDLTYTQQQDFHSLLYAEHPEQRHYSTEHVARAIEQIEPRTVVELGGWDGDLAHRMLERYPSIKHWCNIELCREAASAGHRRHPNYESPIVDDWYWNLRDSWVCDLFVASHTIEHLTVHHLERTIAATHARALFLDAPLGDKATPWQGSTTTHTLHTGWIGVTQICNRHGYTLAWAEDHTTDPASGDKARACLYLRA